jgi:hypothetical protein
VPVGRWLAAPRHLLRSVFARTKLISESRTCACSPALLFVTTADRTISFAGNAVKRGLDSDCLDLSAKEPSSYTRLHVLLRRAALAHRWPMLCLVHEVHCSYAGSLAVTKYTTMSMLADGYAVCTGQCVLSHLTLKCGQRPADALCFPCLMGIARADGSLVPCNITSLKISGHKLWYCIRYTPFSEVQ